MNDARRRILDWAEQGHIEPANVVPALKKSGALPSPAQWHRFLNVLFLGLGGLMLGAGVVFFFAYNWNALDRFTRFGVLEAMVLVSLLPLFKVELDSLPGRAALLLASIFVGVLLALIGQTYQTGADTYELFATWALLVLPWVLVSRSALMWLFWLLIVNLAVYFYWTVFRGLFGFLFDESVLWWLLAINTLAWVLWECLARLGVAWLQVKWAIRILATASGSIVTALMIMAVIRANFEPIMQALIFWLPWLGGVYIIYRRITVDAFVLAGGILSAILVLAVAIGRATISRDFDAGPFLIMGMVVIVSSALGAQWLKRVVREAESNEQ